MDNESFNVLDMVDAYAAASNMDVDDIFKKQNDDKKENTPKKKKKDWVPDQDVLDEMPELQQSGVVYNKDEIIYEKDTTLRNINDDYAVEDSKETMTELTRTAKNIEQAKKRNKIKHLQIPEGQYHAMITTAASDTNTKRAQEKLDKIFDEIKSAYPQFIELEEDEIPKEEPVENNTTESNNNDKNIIKDSIVTDDSIVINTDRDEINGVSWTDEELSKIKRSRVIELNIFEKEKLEMSTIEDVDNNAVDNVISKYERKVNDVPAALPASHYRATFSGLSYKEVIDLLASQEINSMDGIKLSWTLCFNHINNQSIGPWERYYIYKNPNSKKIETTKRIENIPKETDESTIHEVDEFEDFLRKTSYLDLHFMLWKILCATAMDKEIVTVDCKSVTNGKACNNHYDWVYNPSELLDIKSINVEVLEAMKKTGEASGKDAILRHYCDSPVRSTDVATLPSSKIKVIYGHINGYEYLNELYGIVHDIETMSEDDPTQSAKLQNCFILPSIKGFLIPKDNGGYMRITGLSNCAKLIDKLDEIDWNVLNKLKDLITDPYKFKYSIKNVTCPKCKSNSDIVISNISDLLFTVAQGILTVQVMLKQQ